MISSRWSRARGAARDGRPRAAATLFAICARTMSSSATESRKAPMRSYPRSLAASSIAPRRTWKWMFSNPRSAHDAGSDSKIDHIRAIGSDPCRRNDLASHPEAVIRCCDWSGEDRNEQSGDRRRLSNRVRQWPGRLHADSREPIGVAVRAQGRRLVETHRIDQRLEYRAPHDGREATTRAQRPWAPNHR